MAGKATLVGKVAREYCDRHPTASTHAIARMLLRDQKPLFSGYDAARDAVRYVRGQKSNGRQNTPKPAEFVPLDIPDSDAKPVEPVIFTARGKGLEIADLHFPYHDKQAIEIAINHAIKEKCDDFVTILGDGLDCYQLSNFQRDPRMRDFAGEIRMFGRFLDILCDRFGEVWWKLGNHELRYERYMMGKAPELLDLPALQDLPTLVDYDDKGERLHRRVKTVKANQLIFAGALTKLHGHETGKGIASPVNPARGMYLRAAACTLSGHEHKTSNHTDPNIRGVLASCWSLGCLCDLHPEYRPVNKWNHGFALLDYNGKDFEVDNKKIIDGKVF